MDQELFTELIESPIHPLLTYKVRPYVDSCDPTIIFKLTERHFGTGEKSSESLALPLTYSKRVSLVLVTSGRNLHAIGLV